MKSMVAIATIAAATSCGNDNAYDANYKVDQYASGFNDVIGTPNANQNWNLFKTSSVKVSVNGNSSESYKIAICDANPVTNKNAGLLESVTAQGGTTVEKSITVGTAIRTLYAVRTDNDGKQIVAPLDSVSENAFSGYFAASTSTAKSLRKASAVISGDPFTFEDTKDYYKSAVPASAVSSSDAVFTNSDGNNAQAVTEIVVDNATFTPNFWKGTRDIYIKGNSTLNTSRYINQARIYVLPDATLTLNSDNISNFEIYVSKEGTLKCVSKKIEGGSKIYNNGTVNITNDLAVGNSVVLYNEGAMNLTGSLNCSPGSGNPSFVYNYGTLNESKDIVLSSSSNLYNEGTIAIEGNSTVTNSGIWWINKGHYTVNGDMVFSAKNTSFYNYCHLTVKGNTQMYDGEFNLMANGTIKTNTADFDNFSVNMGSNSAFISTGNTKWAAQGGTIYQGFKAATGAKALVVLGGQNTIAKHKNAIAFTGDITYAINEITAEIGSGNNDGNYPTQVYGQGTTGATFSTLKYTVADENSCAATTWTTGGGVVTTPVTYTIAFEDLGSTDDFDFNDVVLQVKHDVATNKAKVYLVAAGGTLVSTVKYDGKELFSTKNHSMDTKNEVKETSNDIDFTGVSDLKKFSITVANTDNTTQFISSATATGVAPQALIIPGAWQWPTERTSITTAYPTFKTWVENTTDTNWYSGPADGKIVK
jgi:hypothetical protein